MRTAKTRLAALAGVAVVAVTATGCMADPPPPVRETLSTTKASEYPDERTINIATDSLGPGFNPHLGEDQSMVTTAIAAMTLPSTFNPVQTLDGDVEWHMNDAVVQSAEVTSTEPFTVTYKLVNEAQWSDGLPMTGDDFSYLWQQMARQPNAVGTAGYRAINQVKTSNGGKEVTVTFDHEYPAWRELFRNLLPSHKLRADPTGFQTGMDTGKPVTGGPFSIYSIDRARDEVRLIRNDRYWRPSTELDQVVLHRAGTQSQMTQTIRNGDTQVVTVSAGDAGGLELSAIPGVKTNRTAGSRALTVNLNTRSEQMKDVFARDAVLGMLDANVIRAAAVGDNAVTPFANTVFMPSDPGFFEVGRPRPTQGQVESWLAQAGFTRGPVREHPGNPVPGETTPDPSETPQGDNPDGDNPDGDNPDGENTDGENTDGENTTVPFGVAPVLNDGKQLEVRIGATASDPRVMAAAEAIADQLRSQGIDASVKAMANTELYGRALTSSEVDLVVGWTASSTGAADAFASQVACQAPRAGTEAGAHIVNEGQQPSTEQVTPTAPVPTDVPTSTEAKPEPKTTSDDSYVGNISGLCDPRLIALADDAIRSEHPEPYLVEAESALAAQAVYLPIFEDTVLVGVTGGVNGVPLSGPVQTGIFGGAAQWTLP